MILTLTATLAALTVQQADPLAPSRDGMVLCITPNAAARTCQAISVYSQGADGAIASDNRSLISPQPAVILITRTPVTMRGGLECSSTTGLADQIQAIEVDGQPLTGDQFNAVRQGVAAQFEAVLGSGELCSAYGQPQADGTIAFTVTMNGTARPELNGTGMWVRPNDGWRVAP